VAAGGQVQSDGDIKDAHQADLAAVTWRKSSWSAYNGNCVEVAVLRTGMVAVRDTKDAGHGPALIFGPDAWGAFTTALKSGDLHA
jgi:hypothetical protein